MRRTSSLLAAALVAALLAACTSPPRKPAPVPPGAPAPAAPTPAPTPPPPDATLASEQRRLAYLFRGTPVAITMQGDSAMRAEVPLAYCFDAGRARVKPPLAAVLDRLAMSQRTTSTRWSIAAPADSGKPNPKLVAERGASLRDYLVARGVHGGRLALAPGDAVASVKVDIVSN